MVRSIIFSELPDNNKLGTKSTKSKLSWARNLKIFYIETQNHFGKIPLPHLVVEEWPWITPLIKVAFSICCEKSLTNLEQIPKNFGNHKHIKINTMFENHQKCLSFIKICFIIRTPTFIKMYSGAEFLCGFWCENSNYIRK